MTDAAKGPNVGSGAGRRRADQKRADALARIDAQVKEGTLTIRKMSAAEREFWGPPRDVDAAKRREARRRRSLSTPGLRTAGDA